MRRDPYFNVLRFGFWRERTFQSRSFIFFPFFSFPTPSRSTGRCQRTGLNVDWLGWQLDQPDARPTPNDLPCGQTHVWRLGFFVSSQNRAGDAKSFELTTGCVLSTGFQIRLKDAGVIRQKFISINPISSIYSYVGV